MVNKNIINIRKKLDKLDDSFLKLLKKRTLLVNQVLKNKRFKKDIIDKKRISVILRNISYKSKKKRYRSYNYKKNLEINDTCLYRLRIQKF